MTYEQVLREGKAFLNAAKIEDYESDGWLLLANVLGWTRTRFFLDGAKECPAELAEQYKALLKQRANHVPTQHLLGIQEFMGLQFQVNEHVLIPRQETEQLVEWVMECAPQGSQILDLCTGSGCIAISLKSLRPDLTMTAVDLSEAALRVARANGAANHTKIQWIQSDLFQKVEQTYDCIVSNPPYITWAELETLTAEVLEHEPRMALDGGEDGLDFYRQIIEEARNHLREGGMLFFEIGYDQGTTVPELMKRAGYEQVQCRKDYAGMDRMVCGVYQP